MNNEDELSWNWELLRESEDSPHRFVVAFKDLHVLKEWDIHQAVVTNNDVAYMRDLINRLPVAVKDYLITFVNLFMRAVEEE